MTQVNRVEFKTVIIDGIEGRDLNILTYRKENFSLYFYLQSVAESINELLTAFTAEEVFHADFYARWSELNLKCITEFELQLLVPINLILEPSTQMYNPLPTALAQARYLNDKYHETVNAYSDYRSPINDVFCIAERQHFTTGPVYHHKFMNSIGFLSLISMLKLRYIRLLYKTFFQRDLVNSDDIVYIYETLVLNRARLPPEDIANVFQLNDDIHFEPVDMDTEDKQQYVRRFNSGCRTFKSFAFNIMDEQSLYISRNLQIMTQFGMDRNIVENLFSQMPKFRLPRGESMSVQQVDLLCREPSPEDVAAANLSVTELNILHSIIKIHLMIQRMTDVQIHKDDLAFYRNILRSRYSTDLDELVFECTPDTSTDDSVSYETADGRHVIVRNYTIGQIIGEFLQLYVYAQQDVNTIWLCKFIQLACNPRYSNLVNIMADFVPFFQRFFTNDFNISSINNLIVFLQGMCRPDTQKIKTLKDYRDLRNLEVQNFKTFSLSKYESYNSNPLVTFMDLILTTKQQRYVINLNVLSEQERTNLTTLHDPNEQQFIDYIYDLMSAPDAKNNDLSGDSRFNLQDIDYDDIVPTVSTNTFNENNVTQSSMQLFNGINNQTIFFHELSNRVIYKVPGVVCNIIVK